VSSSEQPPPQWATVYPAMRQILTNVIRAQRHATTPTHDVKRLVHVRLALHQLDAGTFRPCTQSPPAWSSFAAYCAVRDVLRVTSLGDSAAPGIHRLAADLAEQVAAIRARLEAAGRSAV
jgi:hypothetical protein